MDDLIYIIKVCTEAVNILLALEIALFLFTNRRGRIKQKVSQQSHGLIQPAFVSSLYSALFSFFLFSAFGFAFYIFGVRFEYYYSHLAFTFVGMALVLNNLKNLFFTYAIASFIVILGPFFVKKHLIFSTIVLLLLLPGMFWAPYWVFNIIGYVLLPLVILPIWIFYAMVKMIHKKYRSQITAMFLGLFCFLSAFLCMNTTLASFMNLIDTIIPEVLALIGTICMGYGFIFIPSLNEIFAPAMVKEIFLMKNDGKVLFHHIFKDPKLEQLENVKNPEGSSEQSEEADMVASSIVGIDSLLREVSSTKSLVKKMVQQKTNFLIEWNNDLVGILIASLDIQILRVMLIDTLEGVRSKYNSDTMTQKQPTASDQNDIIKFIDSVFLQNLFNKKPESIVLRSIIGKKLTINH